MIFAPVSAGWRATNVLITAPSRQGRVGVTVSVTSPPRVSRPVGTPTLANALFRLSAGTLLGVRRDGGGEARRIIGASGVSRSPCGSFPAVGAMLAAGWRDPPR